MSRNSAPTTAPARCVLEARTSLGECPVWDERTQLLYFVDINAPALLRFDPAAGAVKRWDLPAKIGCLALDGAGEAGAAAGAVLALASGFAHIDLATGVLAPIANPLASGPGHRFNDGACDPAGRFWAGSMEPSGQHPAGAIHRLDADGRMHTIFEGFHVPNGLAWSPDGARFYINDSPRAMFVARFDAAAGRAGAPFVLADVSAAPGFPDGTAVDAEGFLWNARWDGGGVARFAPDGRLDRFVALPVSRPTSCAFGGPGLAQLFVTSARAGLESAVLAREPLAGGLFVLEPEVAGLPTRRWGGRR